MMNRLLISLSVLSLTTCFATAQTTLPAGPDAPAPASQPTTAEAARMLNDASYGIGFNIGKQLSSAPIKLNVDRIADGLRDASAGKEPAVAEAQIKAALEHLQKEAAAGAEIKARELGDTNVKAGDAYRAENGKKAGVTTTASGLQIETIKPGTGEAPKLADKVKVHYTGTLIDGTKFDSSVDRGEPITFPLGGVIKGWGEGLQLMKVGGKSRLVIPPTIGYGPGGSGPIPPNATLVFDVELISIEK